MSCSEACEGLSTPLENSVFASFCEEAISECQLRVQRQDLAGRGDAASPLRFLLRADELHALAGERGLQRTVTEVLAWRSRFETTQNRTDNDSNDKNNAWIHDAMAIFCVNEVFLEATVSLLARYSGKGLALETLDRIEEVAAFQLTRGPSLSHAATTVFKRLSKPHLVRVVNRLRLTARGLSTSQKASAPQVLQTLGALCLELSTSEQVVQATQCILIVLEIESSGETKHLCKSAALKQALCNALHDLLEDTAASPRTTSVSYEAWDQSVDALLTEVSSWACKSKHQRAALPLLARLLQLVPDAAFDQRGAALLREHAVPRLQLGQGGAVERLLRRGRTDVGAREEGLRLLRLVGASVAARAPSAAPRCRDLLRHILASSLPPLASDAASRADALPVAAFVAAASPLVPRCHLEAGQVAWRLERKEVLWSESSGGKEEQSGGGEEEEWERGWAEALEGLLAGGCEEVLCGMLALQQALPPPHADALPAEAALEGEGAPEAAGGGAGRGGVRGEGVGAGFGAALGRLDGECAPEVLRGLGSRQDAGAEAGEAEAEWGQGAGARVQGLEAALRCLPALLPPWPTPRLAALLARHTQSPARGLREEAWAALRRLLRVEGVAVGGAVREVAAASLALSHRAPALFPGALQSLLTLLEEWEAGGCGREGGCEAGGAAGGGWGEWAESVGLVGLCRPEPPARRAALRLLHLAAPHRSARSTPSVAALAAAAARELKRDAEGEAPQSRRAAAGGEGEEGELGELMAESEGARWAGLVFEVTAGVVREGGEVAGAACACIRLRARQLLAAVGVRRGRRLSRPAAPRSDATEAAALQTLACAALPAAAAAWPGGGEAEGEAGLVWEEKERGESGGAGAVVKRLVAAALQDLRDVRGEGRREAAMVALGHGFRLPEVGAVVLQFLGSLDAVKVRFTRKRSKLVERRQVLQRRFEVYLVMAAARRHAVPAAHWATLMERLLGLVLDMAEHLHAALPTRLSDPDPASLRHLSANLQALLARAAPLLAAAASPASWTVTRRRWLFDLLLSLQPLHAPPPPAKRPDPLSGHGADAGPLVPLALALAALLNGPAFDIPAHAAEQLLGAKAGGAAGSEGRVESRGWINELVRREEAVLRGCGEASLGQYLAGNQGEVGWSVDCCFGGDEALGRRHVVVLARLVQEGGVALSAAEQAVLGLYFVGDSDGGVRRAAGVLLAELVEVGGQSLGEQLARAEGVSSESRQHQQARLAELVARGCGKGREGVAATVASFLQRALAAEGAGQQRRLVRCLGPWLRRMELAGLGEGAQGWAADMLLLTHRLAPVLPAEIQDLWTAASEAEGNLEACLRMLQALAVSSLASARGDAGRAQRGAAVIGALQTAVIGVFRQSRALTFVWLAQSLCPPPVVQLGAEAELSPALFAAHNRQAQQAAPQHGEGAADAGGQAPTEGEVALVLLSSVINCMVPIQEEAEQGLLREHAAGLLHAALSQPAEERAPLVAACCEQIVASVLRGLAMWAAAEKSARPEVRGFAAVRQGRASPVSSELLPPGDEMARGPRRGELSEEVEALVEEVLVLPRRWELGEDDGEEGDGEGGGEAKGGEEQGRRVLARVLAVVDGEGGLGLREAWAREALEAGASGPGMSAGAMRRAGRSLRMYRSLRGAVRCEEVALVLHALAAATARGERGAALKSLQLECVRTVRSMVRALPPCKLILIPQVFWGTVALLHTGGLGLYREAAGLLEELLAGMELGDHCTQNLLFASAPQDWTPPYDGITPLVLPGLCDARTHTRAAGLLRRIINQRGGMVLDPTPRHMLMCIIALLPDLLHSVDSGANAGVGAAALTKACQNRGLTQLQKVFDRLSRPGQYRAASALLSDVAAPLHGALFGYGSQVHAIDGALHLASQAQGAPEALRRYAVELLLVIIRGDRRGALAEAAESVAAKLLPLLQGPLRRQALEALHALRSA